MSDQTGTNEPRSLLQPGQTLIFLGDHTSPDDPGYVRILQDVLQRFHPELRANLISAGAPGQTASALHSRELMQIITSSKPDWLVIGIGLGDAMHEPAARRLLDQYRKQQAQRETDDDDATFGPEVRVRRSDLGPSSDIGREPDPDLPGLGSFRSHMSASLDELGSAGIRSLVMTTIIVGNDLLNPVNSVLRLYNRAIREAAQEAGSPVADIEKSFRNVFDRAGNYKQKVALTGPTGNVNAQGEALIARTLLETLGVLPYPGYRPLR